MTVIIPTYNESKNIERVVDRCLLALEESGYRTEILVIDDDSPDGTADIVRSEYGGDDRVGVVRRTGNQGLARAVTEGFRRADHEYFAVIDADLQHPPERLPTLLGTLEGDAQVAIGSRYVEGGGINKWSRYRKVLSRVGTRLARTSLRELRGISDPLSGFFVVERSVVEGIDFDSRGYKILLEILVKGDYARVTEVPYVFSERERGASKLTRDECVRFLEHLLVLRYHGSTSDHTGSTTKLRRTDSFDESDVSSETSAVKGPDVASPDIAVVTPYPPAKDGVADYAKKLVEGYTDLTESVLVLGSGANAIESTIDNHVDVEHVWQKDDPRGLVGLARALWRVRRERDVVHFNIKPTYFGSSNVLRFFSLSLPLFGRLIPGFDVVVTMHDLFEGVSQDGIGEDVGIVERLGATIATQLVLCSGPVTVTTPEYRALLEAKYPIGDVQYVPHGVTRTDGPGTVDTDPFRLLLFGYISPYKDYETVFEAFDRLRDRYGDIELWVVGDSHPDHREYSRRIRSEYEDLAGVRFFGYVDESDLPGVFADASLLVLPYRTAPGVSGPYQEAKAYGRPALVYDYDDVLRATVETGGDAFTTPPGDPTAMANTVGCLVENPDRLHRVAEANAETEDPTMTDVAHRILKVAGGTADE